MEQRTSHDEAIDSPPPGTRAMAMVRWGLVALMAALAVATWSRSFDGGSRAVAAVRYQCPMHPTVLQAGPGSCPICGMGLVKLADGPAAKSPAAESPVGLVPVKVDPDRARLAGVRTEKASRQRIRPRVRTSAAVGPDETTTTVVDARMAGWIAGPRLLQPGDRVEKGQVLAAISGPDVETAQEIFLAATQRGRQRGQPATVSLGTGAVADEGKALRRLGIADRDIQALARRGRAFDAIPVRSPVAGFVTRKHVVAGQYVQSGSELFEIVDLRRVWVTANVSETQAAQLVTGQAAQFVAAGLPGQSFAGQLRFVAPALDPRTRTLQARMELDNAGLKLRPGMSGEMRIEIAAAETLTVPVEAVVDTGESQYVFVARADGLVEPRSVRPGASDGQRIQVLDGLVEGDPVVTTGNFLLDSESRVHAAIEAFHAAPPADAALARH